jgi:hypothetical protein
MTGGSQKWKPFVGTSHGLGENSIWNSQNRSAFIKHIYWVTLRSKLIDFKKLFYFPSVSYNKYDK